MDYTVHKLARLAGVSTRTLRYYDEIGLLIPPRMNSSGYRYYGQAEVDKLQQIMFYRELGLDLQTIKEILDAPDYNRLAALAEHRDKLLMKRKQLELLIANVEKTIAAQEGRCIMSDREKFEGFKQKLIDDNESKYGKEIRKKYGTDTVDASYQKLKNMTPQQYEEMQKLTDQVNEALRLAVADGYPGGKLAMQACDLHRQWLMQSWPQYSKEAHMGLAQMYVDDERFAAYYDQIAPGCAVFLRDAMKVYTGME
ncbi:MAG TPA: MerR family transcriptional regulator [Syntrophomonas sp.]|nr:MerR family transcriptional regulator [Syntrophomonas sp.]HRW12637.1 MerR family transcriptional regulator [Syntrophomonas sp.]